MANLRIDNLTITICDCGLHDGERHVFYYYEGEEEKRRGEFYSLDQILVELATDVHTGKCKLETAKQAVFRLTYFIPATDRCLGLNNHGFMEDCSIEAAIKAAVGIRPLYKLIIRSISRLETSYQMSMKMDQECDDNCPLRTKPGACDSCVVRLSSYARREEYLRRYLEGTIKIVSDEPPPSLKCYTN